jgi:hypothetical protein
MELLTDGTVMVHSEQDNSQLWYKLTPDNTGSYINGTWKQMASMPSGYAPLYFGSAFFGLVGAILQKQAGRCVLLLQAVNTNWRRLFAKNQGQ